MFLKIWKQSKIYIFYFYLQDVLNVPRKARYLKRNHRLTALKMAQARKFMENNLERISGGDGMISTANSPSGIAGSGNISTLSTLSALSPANIVNSIEESILGKRPPDRVGNITSSGVDKYLINDREEIKINPLGGRQIFVTNKNLTFFKLDCVRRAKKVSY